MALISTFVTSATLNGLNVTMGYCVRFGFKVQSPDLLFLIPSSENLKISCRCEILQDLNLFLMYGFMMPSIKFEARIMPAGSVDVRVYAYSTKSDNFEMYSCMAKSVCLNVVNLCLAIVGFLYSENLSCKRFHCRPIFM